MKFAFVALILIFGSNTFAQDKVYICVSATAHAYHKDYCTGSNQCTHEFVLISLAKARESKKDPCDFCYGKVKQQPVKSGLEKRQSAGHCSATTKAGSQCTRNATKDGFCWQHVK